MPSVSSGGRQAQHFRRLVGRRVRQARVHRDLSEATLAKALNVPVEQVIAFEDGGESLDLDQLSAIAKALGVSPETLLAGIDRDEAGDPVLFDSDEARRLASSFAQISDASVRDTLLQWIEALANLPEKS